MSDSWDDYADDWDTDPDVVEYSKKAFDSLTKFTSLEGKNVLDFGCGTGQLTEKVARVASSVVAIDPSPKMIEVLKNKNIHNVNSLSCEISRDSINHPIFEPGFDLIIASSVCAFVPDYEKTLSELKLLLKEGGTFVQWDWKRANEDGDFGFTEDMIKSAYTNVGLSLVRVTEEFSLASEKGTMHVLMGIACNA
ncbi:MULTISPECIES: class I SAM-dependent methyltransferase [Pseudoalteromonas]|uniref:class I SAM-dependent DNA methyltransferase n=1 Tax=Pseudoalteromonas TaxID=53246 RepID=UPI000FFE360D|nr:MULTISPECIES: class I SAM-dependent methyltransferase [Pseudoalteromonas]MCG9757580.1 class I SAM-dependent methyltransferase [Pseudoalteromonas sp. Isolate6]NKC19523.1 methyltransferase domain-containing protein [Pseudoalteromonas galatheae]RXE87982.1 SAM-dependent methyltransferase [Pseudoalteromonas sp. A757]